MTLRNVDTPDNTPGSGFAPMLSKVSRSVEGSSSLIQITDEWHDIEDAVSLYLPHVSITLPGLSATLGWRPVISYRVPTGKVFIPEWAYANSSGTLNFNLRVSRRYRLWSFSGATIAAPGAIGAPSAVANGSVNMPTGSVSYKMTGINNVGETTPTAASATVTTGAATSAIDFNLGAPAAGTRRLGIYRTLSGQGGTGPWYYLHEVDAAHPNPYRDTHPDADLDQTRQPPGANGTAGSVQGEVAPNPVAEIVFGVQDVALAASPNRLVYVDEDGTQENVALTITTGVNTQTKVALKRSDLGGSGVFDAIAASAFNRRGGDVNNGLVSVATVAGNPATGQYNVYGYHMIMHSTYEGGAAPAAGQNARMTKARRPMVVPAGAEVVVELVHPQGITAAAATYEACLAGRLISV